ncbi:MAG: alpha/beta fold hydrolase [Bacteroidia bacterium]|nr:alpha/beta fold hydrolase [Bacteroidia bacterium]
MELNYKSYGQGPALIILHGLFGSLDNWATHARILSEHFSVYLVDQRNHGRSPHDEVWTYAAMAADLDAFMDRQGIIRAYLLGHSMGGKTVMQFTSEYPERVEKLIVADMGIRAYRRHHDDILETLRGMDLSRIGSRQEAEARMAEGIPDPMVRQFLLKSLVRQEQGGFAWKFNFPVIYREYERILEAVPFAHPADTPVLFLTGGLSHYVRPDDHAEILRWFPRAQFQAIPDAGHWLHAEQPEAFIQAVLAYLAA